MIDFDEQGFIVLRRLLSPKQVSSYRQLIDELTGEGGDLNYWEGVTREARVWPLIFEPVLLARLRELLGPDVRYLHNSEVHKNRAGILWHRDCRDRRFGTGSDWDESRGRYRLVRVCCYLQSYEESGFRLGVIPGSHRREVPAVSEYCYRGLRRLSRRVKWTRELFEPASPITRRRPRISVGTGSWSLRSTKPLWIKIGRGDCVIINQRLLHTTSEIVGPQYAVYFTCGPDDHHATDHWKRSREDASRSQSTLPAELRRQLVGAGLLPAPEALEMKKTGEHVEAGL